jgi:hypothetical protein
MAAAPACLEEITITLPFTTIENYRVRVVFSLKSHLKRFEVNPLALAGIAFSFFELTDHSIIHFLSPSTKGYIKKQAREFTACLFNLDP